MTRHVIIGNGVAGLNAAEAIRSLDSDADLTMIAGESFPPYSRPMISLLLEGAVQPDQLRIRDDDYYQKLNMECLTGHHVVSLDPDNRTVETDQGTKVPYDRLLIATGANPRPIKAENTDLENISFMRTEAHVAGMIQRLHGVEKALVLGGGLVGFKAAYALMKRGVAVTMLIRSDHPLVMQVDNEAGRLILNELVGRGLDVRVEIEAVAFEGNGRVQEAHLSDGSRLPCDLVVIGKGVLPAVDFVPRDRIEVDLGIRVDHNLRTTLPDVYAAGDVAESVDLIRKAPWVNAVWPVAVEQGKTAGLNMAGRPVRYPGSMGRNVIRVFHLDVLTGGLVNPPATGEYGMVKRLDPIRKTYRKLIFRGDLLVGLVMVGDIEQGGVYLSLMQRQIPLNVRAERLLAPNFNFGQLLP